MKHLDLALTRRLTGMLLVALAAVPNGQGFAHAAQSAQMAPAAHTASATQAAAKVPHGPGSLSGLWQNADYKGTGRFPPRERTIRTLDGSPPPLLPAAAAVLEKRITDADKGILFGNSLTNCLPGGVPMMLFGAGDYPIQILETPGQVTLLMDEQNHFRVVHLGGKHPADPDPSFLGHSIGHWEGDTLVVDTVGLNDRTTLDMVGTPHTEALHVIERFRRSAADRLEIRVTVDDPGAFSKSWETKATWKASPPGTELNEYICENNRNATDAQGNQTFGGAR
jgi:hypothetical protein